MVIKVEKLDAEVGSEVAFEALLTSDGKKVAVGDPILKDVAVKGKVLAQDKAKKVIVFKYKPKKDYRKKQGHRQPYTKVEITQVGSEVAPAKEKPAKAAKVETAEKTVKAEKATAAKTEAKKTTAAKKPAAEKPAKATAEKPAAAKKPAAKKPAATGEKKVTTAKKPAAKTAEKKETAKKDAE